MSEKEKRICVCGSPRLLEAADALLQTADLGFLLVEDQDKPRVELRFQGFFAPGVALQSAAGPNTEAARTRRKHVSKKNWRRCFCKQRRGFVLLKKHLPGCGDAIPRRNVTPLQLISDEWAGWGSDRGRINHTQVELQSWYFLLKHFSPPSTLLSDVL